MAGRRRTTCYARHFLFFLPFLLLVISSSAQQTQEEKTIDEGDAVGRRLQQWEFCAGCRAAVEVFQQRSFPVMNRRVEVDKQTTKMDLDVFTENICQDETFRHYKEFVELGCTVVMQHFKADLFKAFDGEDLHEQVQKANPHKGNYFKKTKELCVSIGACPRTYFKKPAPAEKRTRCDACSDIGDQMELLKMTLFDPNRNQDIIDTVCSSLGYNYSPYTWMEEHCDEIMDEYSDEILHVLNKFNEDPHTAIPEEFCDLLKCSYNDEEPVYDEL